MGADDDFVELLRRRQASGGAHVIGKLLAIGNRLAADLARGIDPVLRLHCVCYVRHGHPKASQLVWIDPNSHRIRSSAENLNLPNARNAG